MSETEVEVLGLRLIGQVIWTTAEHRFYVRGRGWTRAVELQPGDELRRESPGWLRVDADGAGPEVAAQQWAV